MDSGKIKKIIIIIIVIILMVLIITYIKRKENTVNNNIVNNQITNKSTNNTIVSSRNTYNNTIDTNTVENISITKETYKCINEEYDGSLELETSDNTFELIIGEKNTDGFIMKGTYTIDNKELLLKISYDTAYLDMQKGELDESFSEYELKMYFIKDETIEFINPKGIKIIFEKEN